MAGSAVPEIFELQIFGYRERYQRLAGDVLEGKLVAGARNQHYLQLWRPAA